MNIIDPRPPNSPLTHTNPSNMTVVSNDPIWWPLISIDRGVSYFTVSSIIVVSYDWALTIGQEFKLIWRQRWSLMTFLYLSVRYIGIPYIVMALLSALPSASVTDTVSTIIYFVGDWMGVIVNLMLAVITVTRLHVMYQQSRNMLIFLIVILLPIQITSVIFTAIQSTNGNTTSEEYILSGTHVCSVNIKADTGLTVISWILGAAWEVLALSLAIWIAVKHFRELQRPSVGWAVSDCFTILMKTHIFYFASFVAVSCFQLSSFSPKISGLSVVGTEIYDGVFQFVQIVQMFVLGPRLILGVREYYAQSVANSDEGAGMTSIVFQEHIHITTGGGV
ncbi:hypothetical protein K503DRAFT_410169 [Rhizopogon vinicolor AM-OR11-026]|uniref:DUF6533 domain-containing protein n=1 Tax=Rhizopogon vinicolor AM-OR11-026 TaxID=1314800 RepID=A0A1B7MQL4_9AGAM|nr:hypothetical protein K503DRAFT_410169 [Rhizopogon vinicolor AM-OR11-026]